MFCCKAKHQNEILLPAVKSLCWSALPLLIGGAANSSS